VRRIFFFHKKNYDLNKIVSNDKRFMTDDIIKRLQEKGQSKMLLPLKEGLPLPHT
jgi:hypothetical protein